ncbi:hypothetical protein HK405_002633, partial [Cladochytrium tenue]
MATGGGGAGGDRSGMFYSEVAGGASGSSLIINEEVEGVVHYDDGDSYGDVASLDDDEFGELVSSASTASSTTGLAPRPPNAADLRAASANVALLAPSRHDSDATPHLHADDDALDDDNEDIENLMSTLSPSLPGSGGTRVRKPADASFSPPWDASNAGADHRRRRRPRLSPADAAAARRRTILLVALTAAVGLALAAAVIFAVFAEFRPKGPQHAASNNNTADSSADLDAAIYGVKITSEMVGSEDADAASAATSSSSLSATTTSMVKKKAGPIKKSSSFSSLATATADATISSEPSESSFTTSTITGSTSVSSPAGAADLAVSGSLSVSGASQTSPTSASPSSTKSPSLSSASSRSSSASLLSSSSTATKKSSASSSATAVYPIRCGTSWMEANSRCGQPCPGKTDGECPDGEYCYLGLSSGVCATTTSASYWLPTESAQDSPSVSRSRSVAGSVSLASLAATSTSASTAATPSASTMRCGLNWATANSMCGAPCEAKSGESDCPIEQGCYAALDLAPCLSAAVSNSSAPAQSVLPSGIQSIEVSGSTYSLSISTARCGASWQSANTTCGAACSARLDGSDCPAEQGCYADLTPAACLSVYSADSSIAAAAGSSVAASAAASSAQGVKVSIPTSRCGLTWTVANIMCGMPCEAHPDSPSDCPDEQGCYADLDPSPCFSSYGDFSTVLDSAATDALAAGSAASLSDASITSSLASKSASSSATRVSSRTASSKSLSPSTTSKAAASSSAAVAAATPTSRTSRCGTRWDTADAVCGILCPSGLDEDCPVGQRCFEGLSEYVCDLQDATVRLHEGGESDFIPRNLSEPVGVVGYWANWSPYTRKQNDLSHLDLSRVSVLNYAS